MPIPPALILSWDALPPDISGMPRFLLADEYGNLNMLTLITQDIKVVALQLVFPSSMSSSSFRLRLLIEELPKAAQAPFFGNPFRSRLRKRSHLYVFYTIVGFTNFTNHHSNDILRFRCTAMEEGAWEEGEEDMGNDGTDKTR